MDLITEASLEALIHKATDPRNKGLDNPSVEAFCTIVKTRPEYSFTASKLVVAKIQSADEWEALQGLSVLDNCMKRCGAAFHSEIGKFRFLNELIKLVSPKYLGDKTSPKVRDIAIRLLHSWTVVYTKETKIKEAYEMLKKQGVVVHDPPIPQPKQSPVPKSNIPVDQEFENKLKKLLSSKNPEDLEAANRMIKSRVMESERQITDFERIRTNVRLLAEMLDTCHPGAIPAEDALVMAEVHTECEKLRPIMFRLASETHNCDMLADLLTLNEELTQVFERYRCMLGQGTAEASAAASSLRSPSSSLLDLNSPVRSPSLPHAPEAIVRPSHDLLGESPSALPDFAADALLDDHLGHLSSPSQTLPSDLDQLGVIFDQLSTSPSLPVKAANAFSNGFPLQIANAISNPDIMSNKMDDLSASVVASINSNSSSIASKSSSGGGLSVHAGSGKNVETNDESNFLNPSANSVVRRPAPSPVEKTKKQKAFEELDILGETLLQKCKDDMQHSKDSEPEKIEATERVLTDSNQSDDAMLGSEDSLTNGASGDRLEDVEPIAEQVVTVVRPLTDVSVSLDKITPSNVPPLRILESSNGVSIVIHLARDAPRDDVIVYVITTTSSSAQPISDYLFQVVVPKKCKFKLQTPSSTALPPHNPFLPPSAITQILLIANPHHLTVHLTFMLSFTMDGETVTEVGEVPGLPTLKN